MPFAGSYLLVVIESKEVGPFAESKSIRKVIKVAAIPLWSFRAATDVLDQVVCLV